MSGIIACGNIYLLYRKQLVPRPIHVYSRG